MIPEPVLTATAGRLATTLAVKGGKRVGEAVLGSADERRLLEVCRVALRRAAQEVSPDLSEEEFIHLVGIFEELIGVLGVPALPVVAESGAAPELVRTWEGELEALGYDVTTLPVGLPAFIDKLCQVLPHQLRAEAERRNSPLFPMVAIEHLAALHAQNAIFRDVLAPLIPFSVLLAEALEISVEACRATDTPYYTPHVLLALLEMPDNVVRQCLNAAWPGLADDVRSRLMTYTVQLKDQHGGHFTPFQWRERPEVRRAQEFALERGQRVVSPASLFLAVLDTPSNSVAQLRSQITDDEFERLHDGAHDAACTGGLAATPGVVFGDKL